MKIYIDSCMQINGGTGIGQYTFHLYKHLKRKEIEVEVDNFSSKFKGFKKYFAYLKHINSGEYINKLSNYDIIHYTCFHMPFRRIKGPKVIVTVHDLAFIVFPETMSKKAALFAKIMLKNTLKQADQILTVSESVYDELRKRYPSYKHKIEFIYPGLYDNINRFSKTDEFNDLKLRKLSNEFFLYIGTVEVRKNVGLIIKAFLKLKETVPEAKNYKLVLSGKMGYGSDNFVNIAKNSAFSEDIIFTGYISNNDINRLYQNAAAYIFPSIYEGFGSTQLECMEYHLPLILSRIPTNLEISKDYGLFFDLNNVDDLVSQMNIIVSKSYDYARNNEIADKTLVKFRWKNLIEKYITNYQYILGENK